MLELTAVAVITKEEQMRGIIRDRGSEFRVRFLEKIALDLARRIMETRGAVEIEEQMSPTGDIEMQARIFVASRDEARGRSVEFAPRREGKSYRDTLMEQSAMSRANALDAMRYAMPQQMYISAKNDPLNFGGITADKIATGTLTLERVMEAKRLMDSMQYNPVEFLKSRIERKKGVDDAIESSKARVRADNEIRKSTKTPGEALPVVTVKVRKIQMPDQERRPEE